MAVGAYSYAPTKYFLKWLGLTQNISQTLISPCRASCYKSANRKGALASLCLCGSLRQAEASTLFGNSCVSPNGITPSVLSSKALQLESKHFLASSCKNALHLQAPKSGVRDNLAELVNLPTVLLTLNNYLKLLERD